MIKQSTNISNHEKKTAGYYAGRVLTVISWFIAFCTASSGIITLFHGADDGSLSIQGRVISFVICVIITAAFVCLGNWGRRISKKFEEKSMNSVKQKTTSLAGKSVSESTKPIQMAGKMPGLEKCDIDDTQSEAKSLREKIIEDAQNYLIVLKKDPEGNKKHIESFEVFIKVLKDQDALEMVDASTLSAYIYAMGYYDVYESSRISHEISAEAKRKYVLIDPTEIKKQ